MQIKLTAVFQKVPEGYIGFMKYINEQGVSLCGGECLAVKSIKESVLWGC